MHARFRSALIVILLSGLAACSNPPGSARNWTPAALGEISADRCLYYTEAEDFQRKAGGDLDYKPGASKGICLGMRWGDNRSDFASYEMDFDANSPATLMVIRVAFIGNAAQSYDVLIDGQTVHTATLSPTGGYGYTASEWASYSFPVGRIDRGRHTLTIQPMKSGAVINIDCFALGKTN
jgi:hypothetical protein